MKDDIMQTDSAYDLALKEKAVPQGRIDRLVELVDHCSSAKDIAESIGDTFLAYMLAMAIQAARTEMRPKALAAHR